MRAKAQESRTNGRYKKLHCKKSPNLTVSPGSVQILGVQPSLTAVLNILAFGGQSVQGVTAVLALAFQHGIPSPHFPTLGAWRDTLVFLGGVSGDRAETELVE